MKAVSSATVTLDYNGDDGLYGREEITTKNLYDVARFRDSDAHSSYTEWWDNLKKRSKECEPVRTIKVKFEVKNAQWDIEKVTERQGLGHFENVTLALWAAKSPSMALLTLYCNSTGLYSARSAAGLALAFSGSDDSISLL